MSIIFYDVETTGLSPENDQIMQIAAMEADADLVERRAFNRAVRLGIDRVPHPSVLLMHGKRIDDYMNAGTGSRMEVMDAFGQWIDERPDPAEDATFIGWNSRHFDSKFLAQERFRAIRPPWIANPKRHDAMRMVQLATWQHGDAALKVPRNDKGKPTYALQAMTEANGVYHGLPHTAEGDLRGMVNLLALYKYRLPGDWERQMKFADPRFTMDWLGQHTVFLHAEWFFGNPSIKPACLINQEEWGRMLTMDLTPDKRPPIDAFNDRNLPVRSLSVHAPLLLPYDRELIDNGLAADALEGMARRLLGDNAYLGHAINAWRERKARRDAKEPRPDHVGASLYRARVTSDGYDDMQAFYKDGAGAIDGMKDLRVRALARIAALEAGEDLPKDAREIAVGMVQAQLLAPATLGDGKQAPLSLYGAHEAIYDLLADGVRDDQKAILGDYQKWLLWRMQNVRNGKLAISSAAAPVPA